MSLQVWIKEAVCAVILIAIVVVFGVVIRAQKVAYDTQVAELEWELESYERSLQLQRDAGQHAFDELVRLNDEIKQWEACAKLRNEKVETLPVIPESELSIVELIPQIKSGVVHIRVGHKQGSGFVIGPNLIMTARHCVKGVEDFEITTNDGHKLYVTRALSSNNYDISFIYVDDLTCVAEGCEFKYPCGNTVLQGEHKVKLQPLKLGSIAECQLGETVIVIGSPHGKINFNSITQGVISGLDRDYDVLNNYGNDYGWNIAFQTDASVHPGNSGCPIFTIDGVVRGVIVGKPASNLIIAMPVDIVLEEIELVKQKFIMDKYHKEEAPEDPYYNYKNNTEYYK